MAYRVAVMSGSLRKASTNSGLLRAVIQLKHPSFSFEWMNIHDIPIFNQDIQKEGIPSAVKTIRNQTMASDAMLFSLAENNYSLSSPCKNALDWLSRSSETEKIPPLAGKIVGLMSVGGSMEGMRAQNHFRVIGDMFKMKVMNINEEERIALNVFRGKHFNQNGDLIDDKVREKLNVFLNSFEKWITENRKK